MVILWHLKTNVTQTHLNNLGLEIMDTNYNQWYFNNNCNAVSLFLYDFRCQQITLLYCHIRIRWIHFLECK